MTDQLIDTIQAITYRPPVPVRRSTYIPPRETLLNGMPWATVPTKADRDLVKQWLADGLDLGILTVDQVDLSQDDTAFVFVSSASGDRVINFDSPAIDEERI